MFENANESRLMDIWAAIKNIPFEKFGIRIDKEKFPFTRKDDDLYKMLMYLNLLPSPRHSFAKAVNSLFVFTEVI